MFQNKKKNTVTGVLLPVFMLCTFIFLSLALAIYGSKIYNSLRFQTEDSFSMITARNYLQTRIIENNRVGALSFNTNGSTQVLTIQVETESGNYESHIFCQDGYLWEQFTSASSAINLNESTKIARIGSCEFSLLGKEILIIKLADSNNNLTDVVAINLVEGALQ